MATVKFFNDKNKTQQVYPDINPDGNYPGVTVGLANNLTSSTGVDDTDTWDYRSTGGEADVSDGYANLRSIIGTTTSSNIDEVLTYNLLATGVTAIALTGSTFKSQISASGTYDFIYTPVITYSSQLVYSLDAMTFATYTNQTTGTYTFTYGAVISMSDESEVVSNFTESTFVTKVDAEPATYTFTYNGSNWQLNGSNVTMSQYGITTNGSETSGAIITVYYTSNSWEIGGNDVLISNYGIQTTTNEQIGDTITINYTANEWELSGTGVTLSQYGISITTGSPIVGDDIQVVYVKEQIGVVLTSNPVALYSVGMNQFDKNGTKIFNNYSINSSGEITAASGSYVIYFKCLGEEVYTIYNSNASTTTRVGYSANVPTTSTTTTVLTTVSSSEWASTLVNDTHKSHYETPGEGYLCVATTNIDGLCCHLTWEGVNDDIYESYFDYTLAIPYTDNGGQIISDYGLVKLDTTYYDEIDLENHKYYKRTTRIIYSAANLTMVQGLGVPYMYDDDYIYYGINEQIYNLAATSNAYQMSNYGTEEFLGTTLPVTANILYQNNLKDKVLFSMEVIDNKVTSVNSSSNNTQYPSAKCVYDLDIALRHILGLDVNTFSTTKTYAVGDYVVYNLKLWRCKTAVSSAGAWTGTTNWEESYLFKAS